MREFQRKRKTHRLLYSRITLLLLLGALGFLVKAAWGVYERARDSNVNLTRVQTEFAALEARRSLLEEKLARLKTTAGVEAEIREQFQVAKPGEKMVVIVEERQEEDEEGTTPKQSLVSKFFDLFR